MAIPVIHGMIGVDLFYQPEGRKCLLHEPTGAELAKPNYSYEKRQRELARKKKKDEKKVRRQDKEPETGLDDAEQSKAVVED